MEIKKERIAEILKKAEADKNLFNWCEEYKNWVNNGVCMCLTAEIEYILKKSYEDNDAPFSYEDIEINPSDEEIKERLKEQGKSKKEIKKAMEELNDDYENARDELISKSEIYEYWALNDDFAYWLQQDETNIFIKNTNIWCRQTTGQDIQVDGCVINAFLKMLMDRYE